MKILRGVLGAWFASLTCALGQVTVEVVLDQQQFLPGEAVSIAVRITNHSGQTLKLGSDDEWLSLALEARDKGVVRKLDDPPVKGEFILESSQRATRWVELVPYYDLSRQGRYRLQATVKIASWDRQFTSEPVSFDIISGARIWEREFGVPQGDATALPEVRKYIVQEANYLKRDLRLYVRVTDASEARIFRVLAVGPMVSFGKPQPQLDAQNNLHLLFQRGRTFCTYVVINPEGEILVRQSHETIGSRPRLQLNDQGRIMVTGGVRRYLADDVPRREVLTNPVQAATNASDPTSAVEAVLSTNAVSAPKP